MGWVRGVRTGSLALCKILILIGYGRKMGSFGILCLGSRVAGAGGPRGASSQPRTEAREVSEEKTCLPTSSISDVASAVAGKYFVYSGK